MSQHKNKRVMGKAVAGALAMAMVIGNFAVCVPANAYAEDAETVTQETPVAQEPEVIVVAPVAVIDDAVVSQETLNILNTNENLNSAEQIVKDGETKVDETLKGAEENYVALEEQIQNVENAGATVAEEAGKAADALGEVNKAQSSGQAQQSADAAGEAAGAAQNAADAAVEAAKKADEEYEAAKKAYEAAVKAAQEAEKAANEKVDAAAKDMQEKVTVSEQAKADADKALDEANNAKDAADKAAGDANKALGDANDTKDAADKALGDANDAKDAADKALGDANDAKDAADADKAAADAAKAKADADKAKADADKAAADQKVEEAQTIVSNVTSDLNSAKETLADATKALAAAQATESENREALAGATEAAVKTGAFLAAAEAYETASWAGVEGLKGAIFAMEEAKKGAAFAMEEAAKGLESMEGDKTAAQAAYDAAVAAYEAADATLKQANSDLESANVNKDAAEGLAGTEYGKAIMDIEKEIQAADVAGDTEKVAAKKEELIQTVIKHELGASEVTTEVAENGTYYLANGRYYKVEEANGNISIYEYTKETTETIVTGTETVTELPKDKAEWTYDYKQLEGGQYVVEYLDVKAVDEEKKYTTQADADAKAAEINQQGGTAKVYTCTESVTASKSASEAGKMKNVVSYATGTGEDAKALTCVKIDELGDVASFIDDVVELITGEEQYVFYYEEKVVETVLVKPSLNLFTWYTEKREVTKRRIHLGDVAVTYNQDIYQVVEYNKTVNTTYNVVVEEGEEGATADGSYENITEKLANAQSAVDTATGRVSAASGELTVAQTNCDNTEAAAAEATKKYDDAKKLYDTVNTAYEYYYGNKEVSYKLPEDVTTVLNNLGVSDTQKVVESLDKYGVLKQMGINAEEVNVSLSADGVLQVEIPGTSKYAQHMLAMEIAKKAAEQNLEAAKENAEQKQEEHSEAVANLKIATKNYTDAVAVLAKATENKFLSQGKVQQLEDALTIANQGLAGCQQSAADAAAEVTKLTEAATAAADAAKLLEEQAKAAKAAADAAAVAAAKAKEDADAAKTAAENAQSDATTAAEAATKAQNDADAATKAAADAADVAKKAAEAAEAAQDLAEAAAKAASEANTKASEAQAAAEAAKAAAEAAAKTEADVKAAQAKVEDLKNTASVSADKLAEALKILQAAEAAKNDAAVQAREAQAQADTAQSAYTASLAKVEALRVKEAEMYSAYMSYLASLRAAEETIEDEQVPLADLSASEGREIRTFGDEMYIYDAEGKLVKNEFSVFEDENGKLYMVFTNEKGIIVKNMFIVEDEDGNYELVTAEAMNEDEDIDFEEVFVYWAGEDGIIVRDDEVEVLDYIYTADEEGVIVSREEKEEEAIA